MMNRLGRALLPVFLFASGMGCSEDGPTESIDTIVDIPADAGPPASLILAGDVVRDRIAGGWVGQMVGVMRVGATEFQFLGEILSPQDVPEWSPEAFFIAYLQDDLYVEVPFLEALKENGILSGWDPVAKEFEDTEFLLWHANEAARSNLRAGIPAPDSGHYLNNPHCDDIDWQIESDFIGLLTPGMARTAAEMAWRFGHIMNYGDGVYGGVFVAAMHAEAFIADEVGQVIDAGLAVIPKDSGFRRVIDDVIAWHQEEPDWEKVWQALQDKWGEVDRCPEGQDAPFNIDAKLNAAYVVMGLLYGGGDFEKSMVIATRCGQDTDCNSSTVGGILGTMVGLSGIPETFTSTLEWDRVFSYTDYTLQDCVDVTETLARAAVESAGGSVDGTGDDAQWTIPVTDPTPLILEQWPAQEDTPPDLEAKVLAVDGRMVTFEATASDDDGIADTQWFFGDLDFGNGAEVAHTYRVPGTYEVVVWAADPAGNTSWSSIEVTVP